MNWASMSALLSEVRQALSEDEKVIKTYTKKCDPNSVGKNVRHFIHKSDMDQKQAVAASLSILKRSCGVKSKKRMTPKQIAK